MGPDGRSDIPPGDDEDHPSPLVIAMIVLAPLVLASVWLGSWVSNRISPDDRVARPTTEAVVVMSPTATAEPGAERVTTTTVPVVDSTTTSASAAGMAATTTNSPANTVTTTTTNSPTDTAGTTTNSPTNTAATVAAPTVEVTTTTAGPVARASTSSTTARTTTAISPTTSPVPPEPVTSIQLVPPVRDVIVVVNGRSLSTDAAGTIALADGDRHGTVGVVGVLASPAVQRVEFLAWSDGDVRPVRRLDEMAGPVARAAIAVQSRVTVVVDPAPKEDATVEFTAEIGPIAMEVGTSQWIVMTRGVRRGVDLVAEDVHYTARVLVVADVRTALAPQSFVATPEAQWVVMA